MNPPGGAPRAGLYLTNFALGGVQRVNLTVAEGLLANGWQVDLYVVDARGPLADQVPAGVSVFNLGGSGAIRAFGGLLQTLRQRKPSVLMSSQPHLNTLAVLARLLGGYRGRLVLSEHVSPVQHAQGSAIRKDRLNPLMARLFYRFADAVVCVSAQVAEELRQLGAVTPEQVRVIHNPIVTNSMLKQAEETVELPWQMSPDMRLILGAGRLTRQKDFATLISAFASVYAQLPGTRLLIIGEGEDKPALQAQIDALGLAGVAHLGGFVANPYAYMRAADLFVMPSRWEGFGNVLVEALACGTPVCSTNCPHGPAEILAGGKFGRLAPVGDPAQLADAILASLAQPLPADACRERARDFSLERIIPLYINVLAGRLAMRVLHIINTLEMGGAQTVLLQLLRAWPKTDAHCVISLRPAADLDGALTQTGAQVLHVGANPLRLLAAARAFRPDLIQSWLYHSDLAATGVALALGVPLVWGVHHTTTGAGSVKRSTLAVVRLLSFLSRLPGRVPARIICCSRSAMETHLALGYPAAKCVLIENGIDTNAQTHDPAARAAICAELVIPSEAAIIGMFARFNPQKDHKGFLRAAALFASAMARGGRQAFFLLAGPGVEPGNPELAAWVAAEGLQANVRLLGTRTDVPRLISAVDVLTLSSAYGEALPMILCEGMAQGAMCVATDVGDSAKLIGDAGWVVPPSEPQALSDAWQAAIYASANAQERQRLAALARQRVEQGYGIDAMLQRYQRTYRQVLGQ